ncbi:helix-hairpin-helix domain-containing protein [Lactococcus insecticola]|uniref:Competence protein CelA n=1 Tax=Pseudolactococcus insecticola TaxID=2709158 RepID=A0A6A0B4R1_9LACT|nr:helix-hairpin-helix domain-containing protein [Lactococcus insecticola]GFH39685.1 competence protein CelA [Lactococcus insecticola]
MLQEKIREHMKLIVGAGIVVLVVVIFGVTHLMGASSNTPASDAQPLVAAQNLTVTASESSGKTQSSDKETTSDFLIVDVKGAVKNPNVYQVKAGARVNDAILQAGGLTAQADAKSVNLAQKVTDEMVVYVAAQGEVGLAQANVTSPANATGTSAGASEKVNLNTADLTQLQTLSGIGAKKAQDIIDYREQNGNFKAIEDLSQVSGFGEKTLEKLKESITVD